MPGMCVSTMKVFEHEGCIEEERDKRKKKQEKETAVEREVKIKLAEKKKNHIKQIGCTNGKRKE